MEELDENYIFSEKNSPYEIYSNKDDSEDEYQFSGLLPSSVNKKFNDGNSEIPEINLSETLKKKDTKVNFFRLMTRTNCEISPQENKAICDNIVNYFKHKENYLFPEKLYDETHNQFSKNTINLNSGLNNIEESYSSDIDSLIFIQKILNHKTNMFENYSELALLQKNKQIFLSLNPINFNVLIVGESMSGKTFFIKNFIKKFDKISKLKNTVLEQNLNLDLENEMLVNEQEFVKSKRKFDLYDLSYLSISQNYYLRLFDSYGYSSELNKNDWLNDIIEFISNKNLDYYNAKHENDKGTHDCRIHLILYFITGPKPKTVDYSMMKELKKMGNILPIISNSDTNDFEQILNNKSEMISLMINYDIEIFDVSSALLKLCKNQASINCLLGGKLGFCPPFLLSMSNKKELLNNKFSVEDLENPEKSDFLRLYYILACYIPFECVEKTKKYYKFFKQNFMYTKEENSCTQSIWWKFLLVGVGIISVSLIYICKKKY